MRKRLIIPTILAIAVLSFGANLALAGCGSCGSSPSTATAPSSCGSKGASTADASNCKAPAGMTAAECAAACAAKGASMTSAECATACATQGAQASAACATKGAQASAACASGASAAHCSANGDFFISNYMGLRAAMDKHCNVSMDTAAATYRTGLQNMIASGQANEHREALTSLASQLEDWPSDTKAQQARFNEISEWVASYCEMFPEKTAGAKVVTCPTSGHRWVEIEGESNEDQS